MGILGISLLAGVKLFKYPEMIKNGKREAKIQPFITVLSENVEANAKIAPNPTK